MKNYHFFVDDIIFTFRDLTLRRPPSLFDNGFLRIFRDAHERYGTRTQLNIFYRLDRFYGKKDFCLADMTDAYRGEWEACADWLRLAPHAYSEFPDYPYLNAGYDFVKRDFEEIRREVFRFAGERSFSYAMNPHWLPVSREGCRALYDCGVRILGTTYGDRLPAETREELATLPYGHDGRLLQDRKPETGIFMRKSRNTAINVSLHSHNHIDSAEAERTTFTRAAHYDETTGLYFKRFCNSVVVNLCQNEEIIAQTLAPLYGREYVGIGSHEQYYYENYYNYQPNYRDKTLSALRLISEAGYTSVYPEELL